MGPSGIEAEQNVKFDVTRQVQMRVWYKKDEVGQWDPDSEGTRDLPLDTEEPNDDLRDLDESDAPTAARHFYSHDVLGVNPGNYAEVQAKKVLMRGNFDEWVRVTIGSPAERAAGNNRRGSRGSSTLLWHGRQYLVLKMGAWQRSTLDATETDENDIGPDHIDVDAELP